MNLKKLFNATLFQLMASLVLIFIPYPVFSINIESEILKKVETSKRLLEKENERILKEKKQLTKKLNVVSFEIKKLEKIVNDLKRAEDESSLNLNTLIDRAERWEQQVDYQINLIDTFLELSNSDTSPNINNEISISGFINSLEEIESKISPQVTLKNVSLPSGNNVSASVIKLGPIQLFNHEESQSTGLYVEASGINTTKYVYTSNDASSAANFFASGEGKILFDPTSGRAFQYIENKETLTEHLEKGGAWIIPILFFAVLSLALSLVKLAKIIRLPKYSEATIEELEEKLKSLSVNNDTAATQIKVNGALEKIFSILTTNPASSTREELLVSEVKRYRHEVEKYIDVIAMTAAVAPLLGLLGTVSGMMETFKMLTLFGSGDPSAISGGISEALVTTEFGLIVAIPSLISTALLSRSVKSYFSKYENTVVKLNAVAQ